MIPAAGKLTSGRLLARNAVLNLVGQGAPLLVAVFAIPLLIQGLGTDRFGVLTLAWMVIGYFSLFDLGLGRALTQLVSERLADGRADTTPSLTWTALSFMLLLGSCGALLLALGSPWIVRGALALPDALRRESLLAFYWLALSLPLVVSTTGLRGILEAYQRFDLINAVRVPMGVFTFLGPLLVLPFSSRLDTLVAVLAGGRLLAWVAHLVLCLRAVPSLLRCVAVDPSVLRPLLRFGGWMTVSNLVSPLMVYFDRFVIAALLSVTAVTYYVTPYEVVTKLWLIPSALLGVLFPAFAAQYSSNRAETLPLFERAVRVVFLPMFPVTLLLVAWAPEILLYWLGSDFAVHGTPVLRWLALGVFVNSVGQVPFTVVQSIGRPDLTGKLHLLELPLYGFALWWLIGTMGLEGAAIAWVLRVSLDTVALFAMAARLLPGSGQRIGVTTLPMLPALLALWLALVPHAVEVKALFTLAALTAFAWLAWNFLLGTPERVMMRSLLRLRRERATSS